MPDPSCSLRFSPQRKAIHLATSALPLSGWLVAPWVGIAVTGALLAASLIIEIARRRWAWVNHWLWRLLPSVFRDWENQHVLGSTWLVAGMLPTLVLFEQDLGGTACLFLAWGDLAAEVAGHWWGSPGQRKSLAGSLGCFAVCCLAGAVGVMWGGLSPWTAIVGAVTATLLERWSPPPDDNLWLPLVSGLTMWGFQAVTTV